ncbi:MAG TPA: GTPase Era [Acholeplasmataceae bacterium]|jgi:GTP-binding protein Era|nr:GTPase Era [Acholeplasmataceae bacterium]
MEKDFKSGFVAIIGRPNVGKSTFLNYVLGEKISIISQKPQTTRNRIQGIYTSESEQIIFIDTPGIHKPLHGLGEFMNKEAFVTLRDVEIILYLVSANLPFGRGDEFVISLLKKVDTPVFLVFNKIDLIKDKGALMENVVKFTESFDFSEVFYISALTGENTEKVMNGIISYLEPGPMYYPKNQKSNYPEKFIVGEIIREKVLTLTAEEVPHSVAVVIEAMEADDENPELLNIRAVIYVERPSQKKIIIGSGGKMIKKIGTLARQEIVMLLGQKIFLDLWVKVEKDWRNKQNVLRRLGYIAEI